MSKSYNLKPGNCSECCLSFECNKDKENMKKFLNKLGVLCSDGVCLEVVEYEKNISPNS